MTRLWRWLRGSSNETRQKRGEVEEAIATIEQQRETLRRSLLALFYVQGKLAAAERRSGHGRAELDEVKREGRRTIRRLARCSEDLDELRLRRLRAETARTLMLIERDAFAAQAEREVEQLLR